MSNPCFQDEDFDHPLPAPGYYLAAVTSARWRRSSAGNRMAHIVFCIDGVHPAFERVSDYLVVEGISPRGLALARSRLVDLYRACDQSPQAGEPIQLDLLTGTLVDVRLEHESYQGQRRLRVAGYRRPRLAVSDESSKAGEQGHLVPATGGRHA